MPATLPAILMPAVLLSTIALAVRLGINAKDYSQYIDAAAMAADGAIATVMWWAFRWAVKKIHRAEATVPGITSPTVEVKGVVEINDLKTPDPPVVVHVDSTKISPPN